jgi:hypothetical protein
MRLSRALVLACAVLSLVAATGISQAYTVYFGEDLGYWPIPIPNSNAARDAFMARLVGVGTEDFESFALGTPAPLTLDFGYATATLGGDGWVETGDSVGRHPVSGSQYWNNVNIGMTIDFSDPQAAFGFYGTDIGDFGGHITLTLNDGSTTELIVPNTEFAPDGSTLYYGFVADSPSETFTQIVFGNTDLDDFFGFDDMTIGTIEQVVPPGGIPEPMTLLVLGSVLGGAGLYRRLRRRAA